MNGIRLQIWDLAGQVRLRPYWKSYYPDMHGLAFAVDAADRDRLNEASAEFRAVLAETAEHRTPIVVLANKCDVEGCLPADEISCALGLESLTDRSWTVYKTSAVTGEGVEEALSWLASMRLA